MSDVTKDIEKMNEAITIPETDIPEDFNDQLLAALREAEKSSRLKSEFLTNVSHELRTPLNGIIGMTELVLDSDVSPIQREYLDMVRSSANDLLGIISDILDYSRIESGSIDLAPRRFNLREQLNSTMRAHAVRAQEKGLEFLYRVTPGVPETVGGDSRRLNQIVSNLLSNAIRFTERGEVALDVSLENQTDDHVRLHIQVRDTGIGIAREHRETIFEPFLQADGSTTRPFGGTGLGLAISTQLVAMMNGRIRVDSQVGKGSTFHVVVELERRQDIECPQHEPEQLAGLPVLVIDDNRANRTQLEETLSRWGLRPTALGDGAAALQMLDKAAQRHTPWPIVLVDDRMPQVHGFIIAETIRERPELARSVIMMVTPGDRRKGHQRARDLLEVSRLIPESIRQREEGSQVRRLTSLERCRKLGLPYVLKPVGELELLSVITDIVTDLNLREQVAVERRQARVHTPVPGKPLRILLAEDNLINQTLAADLLHRHGHEVVMASNGREAIQQLESDPVDLILMDVQMPEMDGYGATVAIRSSRNADLCDVPIIALTAHDLEGDRQKCLDRGMNGYVTKPIQPDELFAEIDRVLVEAVRNAEPVTETDHESDSASPSDDELDETILDREEVLRRVEGNFDLLGKLISTFDSTHVEYVRRIRAAITNQDGAELEATAHGLKGAVATLGGIAARDTAEQLEQLGREEDLASAARVAVELEQQLNQLRTALFELADSRS